MAPRVGLEPTTLRLTAECSAIELPRNNSAALTLHFWCLSTTLYFYYNKEIFLVNSFFIFPNFLYPVSILGTFLFCFLLAGMLKMHVNFLYIQIFLSV